jgi:DNA-binding MarR family transcriptional regulator
MDDEKLHRALLGLAGFLNRPQADTMLLRRAGSTLDRALFPLLIRAGLADPLTVGALADLVGRHYSTVSRQVSALEQAGMVTRGANEADGRSSLIQVTPAGRAEIERIGQARRELMSAVLAGWADADKTTLAELATRLVADLDRVLAASERRGRRA